MPPADRGRCAAPRRRLLRAGPAFENGAFTEALLNGLRTPVADVDGDGAVSEDELRDCVIAAVPGITGGRQHPAVDKDNIW